MFLRAIGGENVEYFDIAIFVDSDGLGFQISGWDSELLELAESIQNR